MNRVGKIIFSRTLNIFQCIYNNFQLHMIINSLKSKQVNARNIQLKNFLILMAERLFLNKGFLLFVIISMVSCSNLRQFGCTKRASDKSCLQCRRDFYLNAEKICISNQESCLQYMTFTGECIEHQSTSPLSARSVWPNLPNSSFVNSNGLCLLGYFRNQNDMCQRQVSGCIARDRFGRCARCSSPYNLRNQKCVVGSNQSQELEYCAQSNSFSICTKCKTGASLVRLRPDSDPICAPEGYDSQCQTFLKGQLFKKCEYCNPRWYPGNDGKCVKVSDFCRDYDFKTGQCQLCVDKSLPVSGICRTVRVNITNCTQYGPNNTGFFCTRCAAGFTLFSPALFQPLASCTSSRDPNDDDLGNSQCQLIPPPAFCKPLTWP